MTTSNQNRNTASSRNYEAFLAEIRQFMKSDRIYTDELRTLGWGTDASFYRQIPKVVLRSDGEEEVARIIRTCNKYQLPFTFRAAGTSLSGQSISESVLIVAGKQPRHYPHAAWYRGLTRQRDSETLRTRIPTRPGLDR